MELPQFSVQWQASVADGGRKRVPDDWSIGGEASGSKNIDYLTIRVNSEKYVQLQETEVAAIKYLFRA